MKWTSLCLFVEFKQNYVCLVCHEFIAVMKEYNLKRQYETKHVANFAAIQGQLRSDKVADLNIL